MSDQKTEYIIALNDFRQARRKAALEELLARLGGKPTELLSYEEVKQHLGAAVTSPQVVRDIPLDSIVGSVGRYKDFTRSYLPKRERTEHRWAAVQTAVVEQKGVEPIEVYQIGEAYFVIDGNHRVSVARQAKAKFIQAYVTEVKTDVPISPTDSLEEIILKAEKIAFLNKTCLDQSHPEADLNLTVAGQYQVLEEFIQVHRYYMGIEQQREIACEEAASDWYARFYLPVLRVIREYGLLREFPGRTETDLYLWLVRYRDELEDELNIKVKISDAAAELASQHSLRAGKLLARAGEKLAAALLPEDWLAGPPPGDWRKARLSERWENRLFTEILVPLSGEPESWAALDQALVIARQEGAQVRGLHSVASESSSLEDAQRIQTAFERRCQEAGIGSSFSITVGQVARQVCEKARWTDLAVLNLAHPPGKGALARLGSGIRTILRRCSRPVLCVPGGVSPLRHGLLAFDGSPKAREALYLAAYLAAQWQIALTVTHVTETPDEPNLPLVEALAYLEKSGIEANPAALSSPRPAESILAAAQGNNCDFIITGGFGLEGLFDVIIGSILDEVLRTAEIPVLVCR